MTNEEAEESPSPEEQNAAEDESIESEETEETALEIEEGDKEEESYEETVEEEAEESRRRVEEEEEEFVEERIYTIPLRRAWIASPRKRAPRAIHIMKSFVQRHMKVGEATFEEETEERERGRVIISKEVNEEIWSRGIEKPPRKLRIRAARDAEGNVTIFLA